MSRNWTEIWALIEEATPGPISCSNERSNNVLEDAIIGRKKIWISYDQKDEFDGLVGTEIYLDRINNLKTMEIFALWAKDSNEDSWESGWEILGRYAMKEECKRIVAYTKHSRILDFIEYHGGDTSFRFCDVPL
uniref:Uncharacterized protein n=1 Tax=viral metagenome TaxID=1070528 RepID=A0A6M3INQ7_9ZZZZ